ncbi:MAG: 3-deoxy-manno-octulosonate cytidylyltransferase [Nitrospiraceae bacterium]|nr:3-deoxy-manno-octulosonate cytidylyltransferase [Nitrospiraceae bacterium]
MDAVVIIPARYRSSRFPGKALAPLKNRPLLQHVFEKAKGCRLAKDVIIATDSARIREAAVSWGATAVMTSADHPSGTDRVAEAAGALEWAQVIVNLQGDEPLIRPEMIDDVIMLMADDPLAEIGTLVRRIENAGEFHDPNVVKVVFDGNGRAIYFSRAPIPFARDGADFMDGGPGVSPFAYKHIGIYAYRREVLLRLAALPPARLEMVERLEQLRALEDGMRIKVRQTEFDSIGVDTPEDLQKVEKWLNSYS